MDKNMDMNSLVPVVADAMLTVSGKIASFVAKTKASGVMQRTQLEMIKGATAKLLADARAYHVADIAITNLEQLARTQEHIDNLERQGRLHGASLTMAMDHLCDLNDMLRRILRKYEDGDWR